MNEIFNIEFEYRINGLLKSIRLNAQVETLSQRHYMVNEIKIDKSMVVLPPQWIMKEGDLWVHMDSHKETNLSLAIGGQIDLAVSSRERIKT